MSRTAAQHFEKAEELLDLAAEQQANPGNKDHSAALAYANRAKAHLDAARMLLDAEISINGTNGNLYPTKRTGLYEVAEKRRVADR